jgi:hypothetical protein
MEKVYANVKLSLSRPPTDLICWPRRQGNVRFPIIDTTQTDQKLPGQLEPINVRLGKLNFGGLESNQAMRLLSLFWNRQHATGSVVYRPCFMRDMASRGPYFSELLLNAIYFVASADCTRSSNSFGLGDSNTSGMDFRRKAEAILYDPVTQVLTKSSITTIQALLLMSDALFSWCDERSLSWHYLGIATNMIVDLGIHSEHSVAKNPEDLETSRRVFWSAFGINKPFLTVILLY